MSHGTPRFEGAKKGTVFKMGDELFQYYEQLMYAVGVDANIGVSAQSVALYKAIVQCLQHCPPDKLPAYKKGIIDMLEIMTSDVKEEMEKY